MSLSSIILANKTCYFLVYYFLENVVFFSSKKHVITSHFLLEFQLCFTFIFSSVSYASLVEITVYDIA